MKKLILGCTAAVCLAAAPLMAQTNEAKIGVLVDASGVFADIGGEGSFVAAQIAAEEFALESDIPVEVVMGDFQGKADVGSAIARQWFDEEDVDMIVNLQNSAVALAVQAVAGERGKIDIATGAFSTALTNDACTATSANYVLSSEAITRSLVASLQKDGPKSWFIIQVDYALGASLRNDLVARIEASGGTVAGEVRHPLGTADFSALLLQAQASGADVIALANTGPDTINALKQAQEFGIVQSGQTIAPMILFLSDIHAVGAEVVKGANVVTAFYWDYNDATRDFAERFHERTGRMPTMVQAGDYLATLNYLRNVQAAGTDDGATVMASMRETPVDFFFEEKGTLRADGRVVHPVLLAQVKDPSEMTGEWDYLEIIGELSEDEAFGPLSESTCPLLDKAE